MKYYCSSVLCFNNYTSKDRNGEKVKFYRLPRLPELQSKYMQLFKTSGMNWKNGYICSEHWSSGERKNTSDFPDVIVPEHHFNKLLTKYERSKQVVDITKNPTSKQKLAYSNIKKKLNTAISINKSTITPTKTQARREILKTTTPKIKKRRKLTISGLLIDWICLALLGSCYVML